MMAVSEGQQINTISFVMLITAVALFPSHDRRTREGYRTINVCNTQQSTVCPSLCKAGKVLSYFSFICHCISTAFIVCISRYKSPMLPLGTATKVLNSTQTQPKGTNGEERHTGMAYRRVCNLYGSDCMNPLRVSQGVSCLQVTR